MIGIAFLVLLVTCSALAIAADDPSQDGGAEPPASSVPEGVEIPSARTATSEAFELPNGSREARIYQTPVNYRDDEGDWQPIEEGLEPGGGGSFVNGENSFDLRLPSRVGSAPLRISFGDEWVAERLIAAASDAGELEGETASYDGSNPGTTYEFSTLGTGLEQRITLANASEPSTLHFELSASNGVEPAKVDDGSVQFKDSNGDIVATLRVPVMYDSNPVHPAISDAVGYQLEPRVDGTWELTVEADRDWLTQPDRVLPVTIDPVLEKEKEVKEMTDCTIFGGAYETWSGFCGVNGWQWIEALALHSTNEVGRNLLYFPLGPSTPGLGNADVNSASLKLYAPFAVQNTTAVQVRNIVDTGTEYWWPNASWRWAWCYSGTCKNWLNKGGDFGFDNSEVTTAKRGSQAGWWTFDGLGSRVQGWVAGTQKNMGLLVKQDNDSLECTGSGPACTDRLAQFAGSAWTGSVTGEKAAEAAEKRPYLSIKYWPKAPATSKVVSPSDGTSTVRRLKLVSSWESGATGVSYQWREGKSEPFKEVPTSLVRDKENKAVTWPVATEGKQVTEPLYFDAAAASEALTKKGGTIQIRALFEGPAGGVSAPVEAIVNRFTGGSSDATADVGPGTIDLLTGNLAVTRGDVSISSFNSAMTFGRSLNSRGLLPGPGEPYFGETEKGLADQNKGVLGLGWKPSVAIQAEGSSDWRSLRLVTQTEEAEEGITYVYSFAKLINLKGEEFSFEQNGSNYLTPPELSGWSLTWPSGVTFVLTDPKGNTTTFELVPGSSEYVPTRVSQVGLSSTSTRMVYDFPETGKKRLKEMIAPTPPGVTSCTEEAGSEHAGCKRLKFTYEAATKWGAPSNYGQRLAKIIYYAYGLGGPWTVAEYKYDNSGRLIEEADPGTGLAEKYAYTTEGQLKTITPPGQEPWTMEYGALAGEEANGRLMAVKRPSLLPSPNNVAQTTIAYGVPVSKSSGGPYDLSGAAIAQWGQQDPPVDATAVFPPDAGTVSSPPSDYSHATVYYMDAEGREVNTAATIGASTESITTTEVDQFENVVRELTPQNRLRVLAEPEANRKKRWEELETKLRYSPDGLELWEEWGPTHQVRIAETGATKQARSYRYIGYTKEAPPIGTPAYHLPIREGTGALVGGSLLDERITETKYNMTLRQPTETIVDAGEGHLNITSVTVYDKETGLPVEQRQPKNKAGGEAGTTKTYYYTGKATPGVPGPCANGSVAAYAGLPCRVQPAAQASGSGRPELLWRTYKSYSAFSAPIEAVESPVGGSENVRKSTFTYDSAGRQLTMKIEGGGATVPTTEAVYSTSTGQLTTQRFKCEASCAGYDDQATTTTYDALGRVISYEDADGGKSETTYDIDSRPVTVSDAKGSQTMTYDPKSGLPAKLEDSAAGTFTAAYNADGHMTERTLPNGLTATTTYNETDEAVHLTYTKASSCGTSCTWYDEGIERSIYGQDLSQTGTLASYHYTYDKAGRLTSAAETPTGAGCTTRLYKYDLDSNREEMTTRPPGIGGACAESGGTTQKYDYDTADRLKGPVYDSWGRIESLPAEFAGGKALTTKYFSTDMVAEQTQNGITNTFQLDASLRQRQRVQTAGIEGVEVFHYDGGSDSPAWTQLGSTWSRSIVGIGGELSGIQESSGGTTLRLTNLHGDVVASAGLSPTETKLLGTFRFDEFGNPVSGSAGRFGWLGGAQRRTELASGVIQMGARSYVPQLGRFISVDPIAGGSASAYDYANADPVNSRDPAGTKPYSGLVRSGPCEGEMHVWSPRNRNGRDSFGVFYMRYRVFCGARGYVVSVLKVTRRFESLTTGAIIASHSNQPANPSSPHWNNAEWGNWYAGERPTRFTCVNGQEYQYTYEIQYSYAAVGGAATDPDGNGVFEPGGGTLKLQAQEYCGHGPY